MHTSEIIIYNFRSVFVEKKTMLTTIHYNFKKRDAFDVYLVHNDFTMLSVNTAKLLDMCALVEK